MTTGYLIMIIYPIGFLFTLTFFKYFGVKIGFDYDKYASEGGWYDDWESNEQAFTAFSICWPVTMTMLLIIGIFKMIFKFGKWYYKK